MVPLRPQAGHPADSIKVRRSAQSQAGIVAWAGEKNSEKSLTFQGAALFTSITHRLLPLFFL